MSASVCALAADTKVETPEGALTIKGVAGKAVSVFTREGTHIRFRMMCNVHKVAEQQPVLKITLENGQSFRVGPNQILFAKGMCATRADALQAGDTLEAAFHFPEGYEYRPADTPEPVTATHAWRVTAIESGGTADIYSLGVSKTDCFFLTAGVLCKAGAAG